MDLFRVLSLRLSQVIITMKLLARFNENGFNYSYHRCIGVFTILDRFVRYWTIIIRNDWGTLYACTKQNCRLLMMEMRL